MGEEKARRILIVEDSKDMRDIYKSFFKNHSDRYRIDMEGDAQTALERVKKTPYDLIVLDIIMEPMTGESFLVYARENASTSVVPIVVVSVLSEGILRGLKRFERVDFLQKPITEDQLIGAVEKNLG